MRTRLRSVAPWSRVLVVVGLSAAAPRVSAQFVFESAERERVGRTPRALAIADFDEDGFPDVLCGDADDSLTLLRNDGGRGFAVAATLPLAAPSSVVTADFDEDGHADFFATSETGREAGVGLGDGAGGFAPLALVPLDVVPWESIAADFDRDGSVDVAVGGGAVVALLRGDGFGGFSAPEKIEIPEIDDVLALRAADLDGDGALEIVAAALPDGITGAARVVVLGRADENARDLEPRFVFSAPLRWPASVVAADVNGDGREDLLFTSLIGDAPQLFAGASAGPGEFAFAEPVPVLGPNVLYAAAHDFDRDGRLDIAATGGYPGDLRLFRGDGKGSFSQEARLGTNAAPRRLEIADLDGDGRVDVATANWRDAASGTVTTFLNRTTPASRTGTVNRGAGRVVDVLFVNDSAGGTERVVRLASWESFFVFVDAPPLAVRPAAFALLAWPGGAPPLDEERAMPHGIGIGGRALLAWQGGTPPAVVWNNTGLPALGRNPRPSGPAPRMVVERRAGLGRPVLLTLQGVIEDPGSAGDRPASVTNALTVEIR